MGSLRWVRTHVVGTVVVLEVAGRLSDVVADLDLAIRLALADGPRGVVCDLTAILEDATPGAVKMLARAGRHGRDWPAIPVAVVCPDPWVRAALNAHPVGRNLIVTPSMTSAVSAVLAIPTPTVAWLRLTPHPTAPRAAQDFVTRTLPGWDLGHRRRTRDRPAEVKPVKGVVAPDQPQSQTLGALSAGMTTSGTVFLADTSLHRSPHRAVCRAP